ncbi:Dps family protein [Fluviicola chungangensis]|uniref:DNA starvation/stationary phase protection protein n=1 Tax=Fluviicola chungangensis TaxID=2597671 RepID=A0A556MPK8_9FLAO|nr:Dps family protein [Fluviicola chungangensis]TSJ41883.1 DNA starvation/stationary phase protection protein [Fluviicola chungangensis]
MSSQQDLNNKLNRLLATYQVHYQNLRAIHWNIKGTNFFELHLKYEELYTRTQVIIDDLAERILTLGITPLHRLEDYLKNSDLKENITIHDGKEGMTYILNAQETILKLEREILTESADLEDEGTNAMMSDLVREKEKTNWMFAAWLGK